MTDAGASRTKQGCIGQLKLVSYMLPWIAVWLWLKGKVDFPDSFGHHNSLHGKAGVFDEYLHSDLLLHRAGPWEIILFIWMWAPVAGFIVYLGWAIRQDRNKPPSSPK